MIKEGPYFIFILFCMGHHKTFHTSLANLHSYSPYMIPNKNMKIYWSFNSKKSFSVTWYFHLNTFIILTIYNRAVLLFNPAVENTTISIAIRISWFTNRFTKFHKPFFINSRGKLTKSFCFFTLLCPAFT